MFLLRKISAIDLADGHNWFYLFLWLWKFLALLITLVLSSFFYTNHGGLHISFFRSRPCSDYIWTITATGCKYCFPVDGSKPACGNISQADLLMHIDPHWGIDSLSFKSTPLTPSVSLWRTWHATAEDGGGQWAFSSPTMAAEWGGNRSTTASPPPSRIHCWLA